jgi:hypothetical protein
LKPTRDQKVIAAASRVAQFDQAIEAGGENQRMESGRYAALAVLARTPARTPAAIAAKASVLITPQLIDDVYRHISISVSLANDLLCINA